MDHSRPQQQVHDEEWDEIRRRLDDNSNIDPQTRHRHHHNDFGITPTAIHSRRQPQHHLPPLAATSQPQQVQRRQPPPTSYQKRTTNPVGRIIVLGSNDGIRTNIGEGGFGGNKKDEDIGDPINDKKNNNSTQNQGMADLTRPGAFSVGGGGSSVAGTSRSITGNLQDSTVEGRRREEESGEQQKRQLKFKKIVLFVMIVVSMIALGTTIGVRKQRTKRLSIDSMAVSTSLEDQLLDALSPIISSSESSTSTSSSKAATEEAIRWLAEVDEYFFNSNSSFVVPHDDRSSTTDGQDEIKEEESTTTATSSSSRNSSNNITFSRQEQSANGTGTTIIKSYSIPFDQLAQRFAVAAFFFTTASPLPNLQPGKHVCEWHLGIRCTNNTSSDDDPTTATAMMVTGIVMPNSDLDLADASLPEELFNGLSPSFVTDIQLQHNHLIGTIPTAIGKLTKLTHLDLTNNALAGSIPIEIHRLEKLKVLRLGYNRFRQDEKILTFFPMVNTNMEEFNITHNIGLSGGFPTMERGNEDNSLGRSVDYNIFDLPEVKTIDISFCSFNTEFWFPSRGTRGSHQLQTLVMDGNSFYGDIMFPLGLVSKSPNFSVLSISGNQFSGSIEKSNECLQGCDINEVLDSLSSSLLLVLDVSQNSITGSIPSEIATLSNLERLELHQNEFTGTIPTEMLQLTSLRTYFGYMCVCVCVCVCVWLHPSVCMCIGVVPHTLSCG